MLLNKARFIYCKIKGHSLSLAGNCPFTKITYDYCKRCNILIPQINIKTN